MRHPQLLLVDKSCDWNTGISKIKYKHLNIVLQY